MDNDKKFISIKKQKEIDKFPEEFNNSDKFQPAPEILKPIDSELKGEKSTFTSKEEKKQRLVDSDVILDKKAPRIEKLHKNRSNVKHVLKEIFKYSKSHSIYLVLALICAVINSVFELFIPILIGKGIDCLIGPGEVDFVTLRSTALYLVLCSVGFAIFKWLVNYFESVLAYRTDKSIRDAVYQKFNKVPLKYIDGSSHGDLQSRMINDVAKISEGFLTGLTTGFDALVSIVLVIYYMFTLNVTIALVVVLLTPISLVVTGIIVVKSDKYFVKHAKAMGDLSGEVVEYLGNQKVVIAFGYQDRSLEKFAKYNDNLAIQGEKSMFYSSMSGPLSRAVNGLIYTIVAVMGCINVFSGALTIGGVSVLLSYANKYIRPFNEFSDVISDIQAAYASAKRITNVLDIEDEPSDQDSLVLTKCDGSVDIKDVRFSYTETPLIQGLNVSIKPGQKVAIVGPTGCGKSTLINLLMRFYDVNSGDIVVSDKSIYKLTRSSLRSKYGMVLQDTWLFNSTIKDNIAYGRPESTMEEIVDAAKQANVHDFIMTLPQGYDTLIAESGDNLSQGQKQLLCIARILLCKPPMLILDEATSNIDTRTELHIQEAFDKMMKGRTSFVVAHRLSTIVSSDLILVMNKGNIIEQGTHRELMAKKGFYYALYNSQFSKV